MYCMRCGVKLGDAEETCPLCGLLAYHPDLERKPGTPLYPDDWTEPREEKSIWRYLFTISCIIAFFACFLINILIAGRVTWSGYVMAGIAAGYIILVLPLWFAKPNGIVFLSADVLTAEVLLWFLNHYAGGKWFWSFGFPVTAIYGAFLILTAVIAKYIVKKWFFVLGGVCIVYGCSTMLIELFASITFGTRMFLWSLYPTAVLSLVGLFWILAGIIKPLGNAIRKRMFL